MRADPDLLPNAIEESARLEPAAAVVDRYATTPLRLAGAAIGRGDLVRVSITAANRDPAVFGDPDRFDVRRENTRLHLAFAHGPHFCFGAHLARLETQAAIRGLLANCRACACTPGAPVRRAASSSANRPSCMCAGTEPHARLRQDNSPARGHPVTCLAQPPGPATRPSHPAQQPRPATAEPGRAASGGKGPWRGARLVTLSSEIATSW